MSSTANVPLPALFARSLEAACRASSMPIMEHSTQEHVQATKRDLETLTHRVNAMSLFSDNETLEDISTRDLVYLFVPFVQAEVQDRVYFPDPTRRLVGVREAQRALTTFVDKLVVYDIIPAAERQLFDRDAATDPARRRELKLKQWKQEKEIKTQVEVLRKRRGQEGSTLSSGDLALIASLLPTHSVKAPAAPAADDEDEDFDSSTSELLRNTTLLLLRLTYAHARSRLDSAEQEAALLEAAPPPMSAPPADDSRVAVRQAESDMWRLDQPAPAGGPDGRGPLLDSSGRPLRPFTILPAGAGGASDRARLAGQVFGPSHRLPSMSVDEYLQIEAERGNIISGGGQASEERLTTSEQLALDAEQDGTAFGEQREEERRRKDEEWAQYTDANPKGAGNTMNRG